MKRLVIALLGLVLMAALPSCDNDEDYDGTSINIYFLKINAVDSQGSSLVSGMACDPETGRVSADEYTLSAPSWIYTPPFLSLDAAGNECFSIWGTLENGDYEKTVNYELVCPHIFGDDAVHEIVTQWKLDDWQNTCTAVTVDGRDCPVAFAGDTDQYRSFMTTVVVDRR